MPRDVASRTWKPHTSTMLNAPTSNKLYTFTTKTKTQTNVVRLRKSFINFVTKYSAQAQAQAQVRYRYVRQPIDGYVPRGAYTLQWIYE